MGKTVLVTGGTGSLGKVLVRRLLSGEIGLPDKVYVFSRDEAKQYEMRLAFQNNGQKTEEFIYETFRERVEFIIGDIRNINSVAQALKKANIVINAAALKQVPTCEYFPIEAVATNVLGAENLVTCLSQFHYENVETVLGVSTDKACKPINVMGMTKALQERVLLAGNLTVPKVRFIAVRYGNVLASRGSVIPLFVQQIKNGGPVTITDERMTRFLLSLNKAVDIIFAALREARRGEIYIPRIPAASVVDLARAMINGRNIQVKTTGIRPGEKLHEELISLEEGVRTVERGDYYVIRPMLTEIAGREENKSFLGRSYSSGDDLMTYEQTYEMLRNEGLLEVEKLDLSKELLR